MAHCVVPEAEEILDQEFPVLDRGFVRLVDYLGGDERIVQAARVSYGAGTKTVRQDRGLIRYLMRNQHTSPFEQVVLTFHAKMPIFVARQWVRHRTARLNEISGRYSVMSDEFYVPAAESIAQQSADNKQGREEEPLPPEKAEEIRRGFEEAHRSSYDTYQDLLEAGIARELARIDLPLSAYTQWYWQIDLHNLFHFLKLRMDPHAQEEIRAYAETIYRLAQRVCPLACEAFEDYVLNAVKFSEKEFRALQESVNGDSGEIPEAVEQAAREAGLSGKALERFKEKLRSGRQA